MSKQELQQLNELLIKFKQTYNRRYPIMGAVHLLLLEDDMELPKFKNKKSTTLW